MSYLEILLRKLFWKCAMGGVFLLAFFFTGYWIDIPLTISVSSVYAQETQEPSETPEPTIIKHRTFSVVKEGGENDGVYMTITTYTINEDGTYTETESALQKCEANHRGYAVDDEGNFAVVDGVLYYSNGNPCFNDEGEILDDEGGLNTTSTRVQPDWGNPIAPSPDGSTHSGVLKLDKGTDTKGYNGSNLRYFYNDESAKNKDTENDLAAAVATGWANVGVSGGAIAVAWTSGVGATAVAVAQEAIAVTTAGIYTAQLAHFQEWSENFVGAIDFNSSLTVTGGGTLAGTYENIEKMLLDQENYIVTGNIWVVDSLQTKGNLTVETSGKLAAIDSIQIDKGLTNNGVITEIGQLIVHGDLINSNVMSMIEELSAGSVVNAGAITVGHAKVSDLINFESWASKGEVQAKSIINHGNFHAGGSLIVTETITNTKQFSALGAVEAAGIVQQGEKSLWASKGTISTNSLTVEGGTFTSAGAVTVKESMTNNGNILLGDSLQANTLLNDTEGVMITMGVTKINETMKNNGTWNAGASIQTGEAQNTGTLNILGDWRAASVSNTGEISITGNLISNGGIVNEKEISGTSAGASMTALSLSNRVDGTVQNFREILINGDGESTNVGLLSGLGANSSLTLYGDMKNDGRIENFSSFSATNLTNTRSEETSETGIVTGTGMNSTIQLSGTLTNSGTINAWEKLSVNGKTVNDGTISATGDGSVYRFGGGLENHGTMNEVEKLSVTGDLRNTKSITGTGKDSSLKSSGNLTNAEGASISHYESLVVEGTLDNSGTLTATGDGSVYEAGSLLNSGTIENLEKLAVKGDLRNTKSITGTGKDSSLKSSGDLMNAEGASIGHYESLVVEGALDNSGTLTATGDGSVYEAGSLLNSGTIENLEKLAVKGASNISGEVAGTGTGSSSFRTEGLYGAEGTGAFTGKITGFSAVSNSQSLVNQGTISGTGAGSILMQEGELKNESEISGFQNANILGDAENSGTISGTGFGSQYTFSGNLINHQGAVISEIDSLIIQKDLENYGLLKIFGNVQVHGHFTNGSSNANEFRNTPIGNEIYIVCENGRFGQTTVTGGDAVINGGSLYLSGDRLNVGQNYLFLTVHGEGNALVVNQPFDIEPEQGMIPKLFHAEGFYNQTEYWLSLRRDFEYGPAGNTPNQINTGTYLDRIAYTVNTQDSYEENDLFKVLSALDDISANSDLGAASDESHLALDKMAGTIFANMSLMTLQNGWQVHQNLANIIRPLDCPFNECDCPEQRFSNAWGTFIGNTGNVDSDGNSYGFHYDSVGLIVGYDFFRSRGLRLGAYFQYANANMNERETMADAEMDNYDWGLYALLRNEWGYLTASGNFGYSNYDTTRRIAFGGPNDSIDRTHYGSTYSTQQSLRLESAGEFAFLENRFLLRPFAGLTYIRMQMDDWAEQSYDGNDYVTELSSQVGDLNSLRSELGARLSFCWKNDRRSLGMNLRASWVHEFCDTQIMIENKFTPPTQNSPGNMFSDTASSFLITGTDLGEDYAWLGFGMTLDTGSFWTLFGSYDGLLNGSTTLHTGNIGVSFSW